MFLLKSATRFMATLLFISILAAHVIATSSANAGTMHMKHLGVEELNPEFSYLLSESMAVGYLESQTPNGRQLLQSGFFIDETRFLTALTPAQQTLSCSGMTIRVEDLFITNQSKNLGCKRILEQDKRLGYAIIEVAEPWANAIQALPTSEQLSLRRYPVFYTVGFSPMGHRMATDHCQVRRDKCTDCDQYDVDDFAWSDGSCLFYRSMIGAPVISRSNGPSRVVGILNDFTNASTSLEIFARPKVVSLDAIRSASPILSAISEPAPSCTLEAKPATIEMGESTEVSLNIEGNFDSYIIDGRTMSELNGSRSMSVRLLKTRPIVATVSGPGGKRSCSISVRVIPIPAPTCSLVADRATVKPGESVELELQAAGRWDTYAIANVEQPVLTEPFKLKVTPDRSRIYTASIQGIGGVTHCSVPIRVVDDNPLTCEIKATPQRVELGDSIKVEITSNHTQLDAVFFRGKQLLPNGNGRYEAAITPALKDTSLAVRVKKGDRIASCHTPIEVVPVPPPTCDLRVSASSINLGQAVTFTIDPKGKFTTYEIEGVSKENLSSGRHLTVKPDRSKLFVASIIGVGGRGSCSASIQVKQPVPTCKLHLSKTKVKPGGKVTATMTTSGSYTSYMIDGKEKPANHRVIVEAGNESKTIVGKIWNRYGTSLCRAKLEVAP